VQTANTDSSTTSPALIPAAAVTTSAKWRPRFWDNERHSSLQFLTTDELDAAIDWLWSVPNCASCREFTLGGTP